MNEDAKTMSEYTTEELIEMGRVIYDEWEDTGYVESLGDYEEIIIELTQRVGR